jgi:short-subunit dehydrogenase
MANWMQRLETAWARRHVPRGLTAPDDEGRKAVSIITGGSEGLGRCLANEFARDGHALLLIARTEAKLEAAAAELQRDHGADVYIAPIDLTGADCVHRVQFALDSYGLYAEVLVNNAGAGLGGPFAEQDEERIARMLALNVAGLTALTRHFLPGMLARASGGVLNLASLGGLMPGPYQAAYYASKAYVTALTEALAFEYAGRGLRISAALPGPVKTHFHERMGVNDAFYLHLPGTLSPDRAAAVIYSAFMGRKTLIVPGLMPPFFSFAVRYIPHFILVPFIGWLLKRRY